MSDKNQFLGKWPRRWRFWKSKSCDVEMKRRNYIFGFLQKKNSQFLEFNQRNRLI